jgi:imidazolonepropionase
LAQLILIRGARQLLTMRGPAEVRRGAALQELGIIEDGSILLRDGMIAAVGSTRRIENLKEARDALEISASGRVVMPGFVDAGLSISFHNPSDTRKRKRIGDFYDETLNLMRSCLQHGTLAAELKATAGGPDLQSDVAVLRKVAKIGNYPVRLVPTWRISETAGSTDRRLANLQPTLNIMARRRFARFVEIDSNRQEDFGEEALAAAHAAKVGIKLTWKGGPACALAQAIDRFRPSTICCATNPGRDEYDILSKSNSIAVFSTGKEVFEGPAGSSVRDLADAGLGIALSSGYDSSSAATFSMQMSIALAVVRLGLTPEAALTAATINAAHAAGCAHLTGSLEHGKQGDILVMNVPDYRELPRQFGINHVDMALREGNIVLNRTRWKASHN